METLKRPSGPNLENGGKRERKEVKEEGALYGKEYDVATRAQPVAKKNEVYAFSSIVGEKEEGGSTFFLVDWGPAHHQHHNEQSYVDAAIFETSESSRLLLLFPSFPRSSFDIPS